MLLDNAFIHDQRVKRSANALIENGYELNLVCGIHKELPTTEVKSGIPVHRLIDTPRLLRPTEYSYAQQLAKDFVAKFEFDIVHAHDSFVLDIAVEIKKIKPSVKMIYDSHELFHGWPLDPLAKTSWTLYIKSLLVRKYHVWKEKRNAKHFDYLVTVNDSLANDLGPYFGFPEERICVLRNIKDYEDPPRPKPNVLREKFGIAADTKILVFIAAHIFPKTRNLEQVIDEVGNQTDVALVLIGADDSLCQVVKDYVAGKSYKNIFFNGKVQPTEISAYLGSADVGLVSVWNKTDLSYWYGLENKIFDYLMAEIPILATQQPEYPAIIEKNNIGVCVNPDNKGAYLEGFKNIIDHYPAYTSNIPATKKILNWENEKGKLIQIYSQI